MAEISSVSIALTSILILIVFTTFFIKGTGMIITKKELEKKGIKAKPPKPIDIYVGEEVISVTWMFGWFESP
ncbi:MAG: hypothetical protein ACETWM_19205 [Candidatus Lokiarchaeia archaeon]